MRQSVANLSGERLEEIGVEVEVGDLVLVRDYFGSNHEIAQWDGDVHQVESMLLCSLPGNSGYRKYAGVEGAKLSIAEDAGKAEEMYDVICAAPTGPIC